MRIIIDGLPEIRGQRMLDKRSYFREHHDDIRRAVIMEPRGHADMYGAILTEPASPDGDFGAIFLHNEGYSTMCGHAIIALTRFAVETGLAVSLPGKPIRIDVPAGRVLAEARTEEGKVVMSSFLNVPSFVVIRDEAVNVPGIGIVKFSIAYGGAFYALCRADELGLNLEPEESGKLVDYGRKIKSAISSTLRIAHPFEEELGFLYGTIFTGKPRNESFHSRNVCVFADGEVDRSATGSGVSARAALLHAEGQLQPGEQITIESIVGTTMDVAVEELVTYGTYEAVIPRVSGTSYFTGKSEFWVDPEDPLKEGFMIR